MVWHVINARKHIMESQCDERQGLLAFLGINPIAGLLRFIIGSLSFHTLRE